ncbi:MAG: nucleobase:cation symporter-2 family protein [Gordonia sp. (in: high G+C Gram-positive bacteria)]|uniref:nucleobase:cation symporter-2 family protein n=1 Tax=Gordonia sp. (in: high G+C Gram-positive bacteria) TaxID=84139 RepID=UPI0039E2D6D6
MNAENPTTAADTPPDVPVGRRPEDERLPFLTNLSYGVQHILAMFGGVIAVPLIIGGAAGLTPEQKAVLVAGCLFLSGIATMVQTIGFPGVGSQLPLVQGVSFATVATMLAIIGDDGTDGLRSAFGAIMVAGLVGLAAIPLFAKIVQLFPAVVTGSVITVIGLSLMPVAARWITGNEMITVDGEQVHNPEFGDVANIGIAMATLLLILVFSKIAKLTRVAILLGLVGGTIIAAIAGKINTSGLSGADVVGIPEPFAFGMPTFQAAAIISMIIAILVIMVETTADILAVGEVVETKVDTKRVSKGLRADMGASAIAPVFNAFPATAFAQNVGLVALTGIKSRFAVAAGGGVLIVLGLSPAAAAVVGMIPTPVLGGAGIALFGTVAASGIRTLTKVDYSGTTNMLVVAVSIAMGMVPVVSPHFWSGLPSWAGTILESGISSAAITAVLLNLLFNVWRPVEPSGMAMAAARARNVSDVEMRVLAEGGSFEAGQTVKVKSPAVDSSAGH